MSSEAPPWPSLYNPGLEILHIQHRNATQYGGAYLHRARGGCSTVDYATGINHLLFLFLLFARRVPIYPILDTYPLHTPFPLMWTFCFLES